MKPLFLLLCFCLPLFAHAENADSKTVAQVVQKFHDGYVKECENLAKPNTQHFILKNPALTLSFKRAYRQLLRNPAELDYDPILNAQDIPQGGLYAKTEGTPPPCSWPVPTKHGRPSPSNW